MTIQLAIQFFKKHMPIITQRDPYAGPKTFMTWVFQEAISALEKQMPKKPVSFKRTAHDFQSDTCKYSGCYCEHIKPFNHEYQYIDYKCPACGKLLSDGAPGYCRLCGQALDWKDEK